MFMGSRWCNGWLISETRSVSNGMTLCHGILPFFLYRAKAFLHFSCIFRSLIFLGILARELAEGRTPEGSVKVA